MEQTSFEPDLSAWDAWRPGEVARPTGREHDVVHHCGLGAGSPSRPQTRDHDDLEIAVPADRSSEFQRVLADYDLYVIGAGLPARSPRKLAEHHQTWVRERLTGLWRLDIMREPWEGDTWVFRRDARIRLPRERVIAHTPDGIPYARPEVAVLYKAKNARPKDDSDFARVLSLLDPAGRRWLAQSLELVHPGHRWLETLST